MYKGKHIRKGERFTNTLRVSCEVVLINLIIYSIMYIFSSSKKININIDKKYIIQILYQIKNQLHLNNINLLYGLARDDIIICNNQMYNAALCLEDSIKSFEKTIIKTEAKVQSTISKMISLALID